MTDTSEWRFYDRVNKKVVGWKEYMNNPAECISIHITELCFPGETWNVREIESGHDKKFRFVLPGEYIKKAGGLEKMRSIWFKSEDYEPVRLTDIYLPMDECSDRKKYLDELFRENGIDLTDIDAWLIVDDEKPS